MPKALFLAQRIPYPPNKGEKIRYWQFFLHIAKTHTMDLGCFIDDEADWQHVPYLEGLCDKTHFARMDPTGAKIRSLKGLLLGQALTEPYYYNAGLKRWTDNLLNSTDDDLVFL